MREAFIEIGYFFGKHLKKWRCDASTVWVSPDRKTALKQILRQRSNRSVELSINGHHKPAWGQQAAVIKGRDVGSVAASAGWWGDQMKVVPEPMIEALRRVIERLHYPTEVMPVWVRWYAAYPCSLRHLEEMWPNAE